MKHKRTRLEEKEMLLRGEIEYYARQLERGCFILRNMQDKNQKLRQALRCQSWHTAMIWTFKMYIDLRKQTLCQDK